MLGEVIFNLFDHMGRNGIGNPTDEGLAQEQFFSATRPIP